MAEPLTRNQAALKGAMLLTLLLPILPFLILTLFSNPAYDDYCLAASTLKRGFIRTQGLYYFSWTGRYFLIAVMSLNPLTFGSFIGYKICAFVIILLTFTSIFFFVTAILTPGANLIDRLISASLMTALFSNQMPEITEGYYWLTGTVSYQLANILTLFFFVLMVKPFGKTRVTKALYLLSGFVLIFAIVGSNEPSMIILLLIIFFITIKAFLIKSKTRRVWLAHLTVTILCSLIVISAPGNLVRSGYFPERHKFFFSFGISLAQEARFLFDWLTNPAFILSAILYVPFADRFSHKSDLLKNHFYIHPLGSLFLLLGIVFLGFFPAYWATGLLYQYRTVNLAHFLFLLGWFINISIWVSYLKEKRQLVIPRLPTYVYLIGLPIISLALLFSNNTRTATADLYTGRAYHYDLELRKRRLLFEQCARERLGDCPVQTFDDLPETTSNPYFETELGCEKEYWELRTKPSTPR